MHRRPSRRPSQIVEKFAEDEHEELPLSATATSTATCHLITHENYHLARRDVAEDEAASSPMHAASPRVSTCPNLDAVIFFNAKNSTVDVVQAVGRVMRRAEGTNRL